MKYTPKQIGELVKPVGKQMGATQKELVSPPSELYLTT
jgi:hypothetical protein